MSNRESSPDGRTFSAGAPLVLLVDDDDDFRGLFAESLRQDDLQVVEAATGDAALQMLELANGSKAPRPDLIVLDLMMPRMSGLEMLQRLRQHRRWKTIPVMVLTAVNDPMLTVRLDVSVAYKADPDSVRREIKRHLARTE